MKRLLEDSLPPRAAALLRSAAADVPPRASGEKARLASLVTSERAAIEARSRLSSAKWLGALSLVVVASAGVVGTGYFQSPSTPDATAVVDEPIEAKSAPLTEGSVRAAATSAPSPAGKDGVDVMDLPTATAAAPSGRVRPPAAASGGSAAPAKARTSTGTASLEDELSAVDQARAAFVGRDPALALARVESYRRDFPAGRFVDEANALEIQALVALGRKDEARPKAARFLAEHPDSPYAQRVRSAVGFEK